MKKLKIIIIIIVVLCICSSIGFGAYVLLNSGESDEEKYQKLLNQYQSIMQSGGPKNEEEAKFVKDFEKAFG